MRFFAFLLCAGLVLAACSKPPADAVRDAASSQPAQAARDAFTAAAVKARITAADVDAAVNVQVRVQGSSVTLEGTVRDAAVKPKLAAAARDVPGVTSVTEKLRVDPHERSAARSFADASLVTRAEAALAAQTGVNALHVRISAKDGVVTIEGTAPSSAIKETMLTTLRSVSGVQRVVDRIRISH